MALKLCNPDSVEPNKTKKDEPFEGDVSKNFPEVLRTLCMWFTAILIVVLITTQDYP